MTSKKPFFFSIVESKNHSDWRLEATPQEESASKTGWVLHSSEKQAKSVAYLRELQETTADNNGRQRRFVKIERMLRN